MQSIRWYVGRLKAMSMSEILWRIKAELMSVEERARVSSGLIPGMTIDKAALSTGFAVSGVQKGAWQSSAPESDEVKWLQSLRNKADNIIAHKLDFFDLKQHHLGDPINWHYDHSAGIQSPVIYSKKIDYRDFKNSGDCKLVWEPNRHHQFVVLGRAYRATGDDKYAKALIEQLESWLESNPFGKGMNWRSPLELGIRLINWVWALDLISDADVYTDEVRSKILAVIYQQCWDVARKFSQGTSANNHLVGEAAGVYVASCYFPNMKNADKWRKQSKAILEQQVGLQTYPDGCTREQALGYEFFVIQFYLISGLVGRWTHDEFSEQYWSVLESMYSFVADLSAGGNLPMFGDRDDGYVLDLGNIPDDVNANLSVAAILFESSDFASRCKGISETAYWLFGDAAFESFKSLDKDKPAAKLSSKSFSDSGYYLLQSGQQGTDSAVSLMLDAGELGFGAIAAHGHADALSFILRFGGNDVLIDPGTYDYFSHPQWREYFRKTRAHNTIEVDELDQSEMLGPFLWGKRAETQIINWEPDPEGGGKIEAGHNGYTRLKDPLRHTRDVQLDANKGELRVVDKLICAGQHTVNLYLHFGVECELEKVSGNTYQINIANKNLSLVLDDSLDITTYTGSNSPVAGWFSSGYHQKQACTTLIGSAGINGSSKLSWKITGLK